ncbi:protein of unknown function [Streptomyces sp. KY70]|nr:protein of unknown function [Streptomyces sp. KY70]
MVALHPQARAVPGHLFRLPCRPQGGGRALKERATGTTPVGSGRPFFLSDAEGACSVADRAATVPVCHSRRSIRTRNSGLTTSRCTPAPPPAGSI